MKGMTKAFFVASSVPSRSRVCGTRAANRLRFVSRDMLELILPQRGWRTASNNGWDRVHWPPGVESPLQPDRNCVLTSYSPSHGVGANPSHPERASVVARHPYPATCGHAAMTIGAPAREVGFEPAVVSEQRVGKPGTTSHSSFRLLAASPNFRYTRDSCVLAPNEERKRLPEPPHRGSQQAASVTRRRAWTHRARVSSPWRPPAVNTSLEPRRAAARRAERADGPGPVGPVHPPWRRCARTQAEPSFLRETPGGRPRPCQTTGLHEIGVAVSADAS